MSLHTIVFIVGLIAVMIGAAKPWLGGLAGLAAFSLLFYLDISSSIIWEGNSNRIGCVVSSGFNFINFKT